MLIFIFFSHLAFLIIRELFDVKSTFVEGQLWYNLTHIWGWIRGILSFNGGISPKLNIITGLVFELADYDVGIQHVNHYTMVTPLKIIQFMFAS